MSSIFNNDIFLQYPTKALKVKRYQEVYSINKTSFKSRKSEIEEGDTFLNFNFYMLWLQIT